MPDVTTVCPNPECPDLDGSGVRGEFVAGTAVCPYCGTTLVESPPMGIPADHSTSSPGDGGDPALEPIFQTEDPSEIQIVRSILDGAGIPFVTTHDSTSDRVLPGFDPFRFMRGSRDAVFWVPAEFAQEARALLTEVDPEETGGE